MNAATIFNGAVLGAVLGSVAGAAWSAMGRVSPFANFEGAAALQQDNTISTPLSELNVHLPSGTLDPLVKLLNRMAQLAGVPYTHPSSQVADHTQELMHSLRLRVREAVAQVLSDATRADPADMPVQRLTRVQVLCDQVLAWVNQLVNNVDVDLQPYLTRVY